MALLMLALLLSIGLQGCDLTTTYNINVLQSFDAQKTGDVCQDCTEIFKLLADLLSNADLQKKLKDGIESLCDHLPGPVTTAKICKEEVEKMLPVAISFITSIMKPAELCKMIGLCSSCGKQEKMLSYFVKEALQAAVTSENDQPRIECSFCLFLVKTLEDLLPKERTESAVTELLEEICRILPAFYRGQCEAVIGKFGKTVLDAILSYATPQTICHLLHVCKGQDVPLVDPCTLTTYRCRDVQTALKCGTVFYCQKFAWKPLNYYTV